VPVKDERDIMIKVTFSLPRIQGEAIEGRIALGEFPSASEFLRAAIREYIERHPVTPEPTAQEPAACPAS